MGGCWSKCGGNGCWAPRKIGVTHPTPQNCRQMIPLRSRSDSCTFTPEPHAIRMESNFSRCPIERRFREAHLANLRSVLGHLERERNLLFTELRFFSSASPL